ncbi:MAG TPA: hypothetical protein VLC09_13505 [Polyangiaceae bacterium]|nr:hypothetical protein [Polyangiaceae bacterium]
MALLRPDCRSLRLFSRPVLGAAAVPALLLLAGCSTASPAVSPSAAQLPPAIEAEAEELPPLVGRGAPEVERVEGRRVGDVLVHRFVGSYTREPLQLTERVVAHEPGLWVIDYELSQGDDVRSLRARLSERSERVLTVSRVVGEEEVPVDATELREMMARTAFAPDRNGGVVGQEKQTCLIGPSEFDCEVAHYRVFVGEREASLTVKKSEALGRDLGGEIVALDGTIIYRAELIERVRGSGEPSDEASASR